VNLFTLITRGLCQLFIWVCVWSAYLESEWLLPDTRKASSLVCWSPRAFINMKSERNLQNFTFSFAANSVLFCLFCVGPPLWSSVQSSWLQNGDIFCFLWGTNWIYICYVEESRPPPWSSGQSSWLQIQRSGFDSPRYQIFWEVVGLERGPLSLVSTIKELSERNSSGSGLENRYYCRRRSAALTTIAAVARSV
jgi:hypothetical protein